MIPLAGLYTLWFANTRDAWKGCLVGGLVGLAAVTPFLVQGQLAVLTAPLRSLSMFPVWSANAHDLWWLASGGRGWQLSTDPSFGGLPVVWTLGLLLFGGCYVHVAVRLRRVSAPESLWATSGFVMASAFTFLTGIHENHLYTAIALLAVTAGLNPRMLPLFAAFSLTATFNQLLHDPLLQYALSLLGSALVGKTIGSLTWANSLANVMLLLGWIFRIDPTGGPRAVDS